MKIMSFTWSNVDLLVLFSAFSGTLFLAALTCGFFVLTGWFILAYLGGVVVAYRCGVFGWFTNWL